jgi:Ser/Thr protein kinase RdoA (MazF antagonist)
MTKKYSEGLLNVLNNYSLGKIENISGIGQRKINQSFFIKTARGKFVLQKMHPIFRWNLLKDIDIVTKHLYKNGFTTPLLIKTRNKKLGVRIEKEIWRVLTYIEGKTIKKGNIHQISSAAKLLGKFHSTLKTLQYDFKFHIPDFHDVDKTMSKLKKTLKKLEGDKKYKKLAKLSIQVLKEYESIEKKDVQIKRVIHDDLRIENIIFGNKNNAIAIIDFDTFTNNQINIELGDIIRSWTNKSHELDAHRSEFDFKKYQTFIRSYLETAKHLTEPEIESIPTGVKKISLDLTARFIIDAYEQKYFRLTSGFQNLYVQNLTYASSQFRFYKSFKKDEKKVIRLNRILIKTQS